MPRQHEPRAGETTPSLAVRRAVAVPVPGEDPGADLRPRTPESAPAPDSAADPDASVSTVSSSEPAPGRRTRWGFRPTTEEPATAEQEEERQEEERQPEEQRRQAAEPGGAGAGVVAGAAAGAAAGAVAAGNGDGGKADADADGTGPGRLRRPMVAAAAIVGAVLICVPLLVLGLSREDERTVETAPTDGTTLAPGTSDGIPAVDYQAASPSPSASPSGSESASGSLAESNSGAEPEPKPKSEPKSEPAPPRSAEVKEAEAPKRSAATAVQRLAAEDPGGRHICYRVHVAGRGWSDAVCDGGTAGTAGSGAPITAVNIAVSGTRGTSGGAFVHDPASTNGEGHFPEPWSNAVDGIDNYVGSTEKDAPHMLGFTINVDSGAGAVCQSSYVHDDAWLGLACDEPGTGYDFTYAGTHDNESWIEAVRLTV